MAQIRLQKVLAAAGVASRRGAEELIETGKVRVNGQVVRQLPCLVDPAVDEISINGKKLKRERSVYFMLHKPRGVFVTNDDPAGRKRAVDLLVGVRERVFAVGRLDADSTGLLLMTNDGELAQRLTHPKFEVPKTYIAQVDGWVGDEDVQRLIHGVWGSDGKMRAERVQILSRNNTRSVVEITLTEGRNRQVRRMLLTLGHKVRQLSRVRIGELQLRGVGPGRFRPLRPFELRYLRQITGLLATTASAHGGAAPADGDLPDGDMDMELDTDH